MNRKSLFVSGVVLIVLVFVVAAVVYQNQKANVQDSNLTMNQSVLERDGAPVKGPVDARVTIVEFFDPACGTCRDFYPLVKKLVDQYPGKVKVMLRYAPLHTGSDQVVKMLEAAHRQGKFWQALELLFGNQHRWVSNHVSQPMRARALLNSLALDHDRLDTDMNLMETSKVIWMDMESGRTLNVRATPEFFVNGKSMPSFGYKQLSQLVKDAVEEAY